MASEQTATAIDDALIAEIVRRVLTVAHPEKIILFGSAATGDMTPDSDIDLLIVQPNAEDANAEYVRVRRALRGIDCAFDILFITPEWFEDSKRIPGGIAYPAHTEGKVIHDAR